MPRITVQGPEGAPISYRFGGNRVRVGRCPRNDLVLHDSSVSRNHAEIRLEGDTWILEDLGSSNGTRLNGSPVIVPRDLIPGDRIAVGEDGLTLVYEGDVSGDLPEGTIDADLLETRSERGSGTQEEEPAFIAEAPSMARLLEGIDAAAPAEVSVLITGENGVGKELVARLLHQRSPRRAQPFIVVNCPAIPRDLFESELFGVERGVATGVGARAGLLERAEGGTLLLDEIGDLAPTAQAKILRFLQEKRFERVGGRQSVELDARIVAATNHDLERDIEEGSFRRDLFHRLNVVHLEVPPLRERKEDLPALASHFLADEDGRAMALDEEASRLLQDYDYPGNVRELQAVLLRARLFARAGTRILPEHLPDSIRGSTGEESKQDLYTRLVQGEADFWESVYEPFSRHEMTKDEVRDLVFRGYQASGSYKEMAASFGIHGEKSYKKLLDFLRNNDLRISKD